ncbi:alpha/beta hydrolase [Hymenobacter properus]|uniref:Alpha/beta fold hydrolase n=1 Tax=Hymenobacter properus TaxID=2791026 RepID=A0A931BFF5_9BACT|nr:alpha/beta fold hydrolase [Hymenobacter properus]MBF9141473.1 alpha/beta fold hydrolase [Hymenobacter properus]MBR7720282.1 alpha/beta fold hydrolase [Microvirga sp. SRT04]
MKVVFIILGMLVGLYVLLCAVLYFKQEKLLFFPSRLPVDYRFRFPGSFEERWFKMADGTRLHGLLFHAPHSKGLVFYLHGNGGDVSSWAEAAPVYTRLGYDVFFLDYRGYGKSEGRISSQAQLPGDVQTVYQQLLPEYPESRTVVLGYSVGTGLATWLAAQQHPKLLILQAPYFSMRDLAARLYPFVPGFLVRYPLPTNELIGKVKAPVVLFHGDRDEVIYHQSSLRLKALLKPTDRLVLLPGAGHNGMTDNPMYQRELATLL